MKVDKKVEKVKAALAEFKKDTLTKIITRKKEEHTIFYRQVEFKKWLEENFIHFNKRELKYLGYETKEEITTKNEENSNIKKKNMEEKLQEITNEKFETEVEKDDNIEKLQENTKVISDSKSKEEITTKRKEKSNVTEKKLEEKLQEITNGKTETEVEKDDNVEKLQENTKVISDSEYKEEITTKNEENSSVIEKNTEEKTQEITKNNTDIILSELLSQDDVKDKFVYFLSNIDEFLGIKKQLEKNLVIPPSLLKNEAIGVTVRLWKSTIEEFNKFCDEHKNYTKLQLMSYALTEFLEKYKNEK